MLSENTLKNSLAVARKMIEIGKKYNMNEKMQQNYQNFTTFFSITDKS